jgi:uncharacterized protein with LGFP repeats
MFTKSTSLFTKLFRRTPTTVRHPKPNRTRLAVHRLEDRHVPAAFLSASLDLAEHVLRVEGTDGADDIQIYQPGNGQVSVSGVQIAVTDLDGNTTLVDVVSEDDVTRIEVNALGGDDSIYIGNGGAPTPIPVVIDAGDGNDVVYGGEGNDTIYGGEGDDVILGGGGDDSIMCGAGNDVVYAGAGSDTVFGEDGNDVIWGGNASDTADGDGADYLDGGDGDDGIAGEGGADTNLGGAGGDDLTGCYGNRSIPDAGNVIDGGDGDDRIEGGSGDDALSGGEGDDYFIGGGGVNYLAGGNGTNTYSDAAGLDVVVDPVLTGNFAMTQAVRDKWNALGGTDGFLGQPTADDASAPGGGRVAAFAGGSIYYTGADDLRAVSAAIQAKYASLGGAGGFLGQPTADETDAPNGGRMATFQGGTIYWSAATGAHEVHGAIRDRYNALGGASSFLGLPTTDELAATSAGRVSHFQNGDLYALLGVGVYEVHGAIRDRYNALGGASSFLGLPTSDELAATSAGRVNHFQHGDLYALLGVGVYEVHGAIRDRYNALGGASGFLGLPTTDELAATSAGRVNRFQGGDLYALLGVGVYYVRGSIRVEYNALGGASSFLGLPTTDEIAIPGGWYNNFQHGSIYALGAAADHQAHEIHGPVRDRWVSYGGAQGLLGFPTTDVFNPGDGSSVTIFQGGTISWRADVGYRLGFNRNQAIAALKISEANGVLDGNEFNFFHSVANDPQVFFDGPTRVLLRKLIDGDPANARFQGVNVGNLAVNSPAWKVDDLERKWFEGQDHPTDVFLRGGVTINGGVYQTVAGPLFGAGGPLYTDVYQGNLGDCTYMASLAEVAARNPFTIQSMFTDNGDGTYTVRFGHNGVPDYVTVDSQLPNGGGSFDSPTAGPIWAALAEKAFAQVNESGWLGTIAPGLNSYGALDNGNSGTVQAALTAITGLATTTNGTDIGAAWTAGRMIVLGTPNAPPNSLVEHNHAYAVVGYNPTTQQYTLFNPWGVNGGYDSTSGVFKPGVLLANQAGINQNYGYATWTGAAPGLAGTPVVPADAHPTPATAVDSGPNPAALTRPAAAPAAVPTALPPGDPRPTPSAPVESHGPEAPTRPVTPAASEAEAPRPAADRLLLPSDLHDRLAAVVDAWAVALDV